MLIPKCIYPKSIFAKCTRLASLFLSHLNPLFLGGLTRLCLLLCYWQFGSYSQFLKSLQGPVHIPLLHILMQILPQYNIANLDAKEPVKVDQVSQDRFNMGCFNQI